MTPRVEHVPAAPSPSPSSSVDAARAVLAATWQDIRRVRVLLAETRTAAEGTSGLGRDCVTVNSRANWRQS